MHRGGSNWQLTNSKTFFHHTDNPNIAKVGTHGCLVNVRNDFSSLHTLCSAHLYFLRLQTQDGDFEPRNNHLESWFLFLWVAATKLVDIDAINHVSMTDQAIDNGGSRKEETGFWRLPSTVFSSAGAKIRRMVMYQICVLSFVEIYGAIPMSYHSSQENENLQ